LFLFNSSATDILELQKEWNQKELEQAGNFKRFEYLYAPRFEKPEKKKVKLKWNIDS